MTEQDALTENDHSYRAGYHHGFITGRTQRDITEKEVRNWRYSDENICPPGSPMEGVVRNSKKTIFEAISDLPLGLRVVDDLEEDDEENKEQDG